MSYRKHHTHSKIRSLKPKRRIIQKPLFWIFLFLVVLFGTAAYFVAFYPKFQISNMQISGYESIKSDDLEKAAWLHVTKNFGNPIFTITSKSIFLVNEGRITSDLMKTFPAIEKVVIQKQLPNVINLTVKERKPVAIFCKTNDSCFLIDQNGVVYQQTDNNTRDMVVLTQESSNKEFLMGSPIIPKDIIDVILKINENLKNNFQIDVKSAFVSNPLVLETSEDWKIYVNPNSDSELQIAKMNSLLESEITLEERQKLEYIYLQYKDRAYFK